MEPNWLERTVHQVKLPCQNLAASVRVLHLSDFHASRCVPFSLIENAIELGLDAKPDVICLTGDFVTDATPFDESHYVRILRRLANAAPAFATLGNHDGGSWSAHAGGFQDASVITKVLGDSGITLLHNRSQNILIHGQSITFAGVGDLWSRGGVDPDCAFAEVSAEDPAILLAHNPDTKDVVADRPWTLMLSGHTHGGQVVLPIIGERFVPVRDKRFIAGLKQWNGRYIYITRGVGNIDGLRLNCRPEVTVLDLV